MSWDLDEPYWWFWCGSEGDALVYGPYEDEATATRWAQGECQEHRAHAVGRATPRKIVEALRHPAFQNGDMLVGEQRYDDQVAGYLRDDNWPPVQGLFKQMAALSSERRSAAADEEELPTLPQRVHA